MVVHRGPPRVSQAGTRTARRAALSVVIPALDEAAALPLLLDDLGAQTGIAIDVIVSDGGSIDDTRRIARRHGARVVRAPRGRGAQMNAGRAKAAAPLLLFLHADSRLRDPCQLAQAVAAWRAADDPRVAGHFGLRFAREQPGGDLLYRYLEAKSRLGRDDTVNGDQGFLLAAAYFDALGGFDERLPILEDRRLAAKIFVQGGWILLPGVLETSARRFESEGPWRRYALMAIVMGMDAAGADGFFAEAPAVYRAQRETRGLQIAPFLPPALRALRGQGPGGAIRLARYVAANAWQLAFFGDVAMRHAAPEWLRRFDRLSRRLF